MATQRWWTTAFNTARDGRWYRWGNRGEGVAIPFAPRYRALIAAAIITPPVWLVLWLAGVRDPFIYAPIPFFAGYLTKVKIRDGLRIHEYLAALVEHRRTRRGRPSVAGYEPIRPDPVTVHRPRIWKPDD